MCAIAGIFNKNYDVDPQQIESMCERMRLRGPDHKDIYLNKQIALGHRRLSIIDLNTGSQPMYSRDRSVVIVFNGEIYNFLELKKELQNKGQLFSTQSDTEVIINGYLEYGIQGIIQRLEGMFAFILYDINRGDLYIVRDKFGEKPLFILENTNQILFASELKAFAPNLQSFHIDYTALNYFLTLSYIPAPYTIYKEIRKLKPATYWHIKKDGEKQEMCYYHLNDAISDNSDTSFEEAQIHLKEMLIESVKKRMITDVPIGAFLSGGIDSSIICTIMSQLSQEPIHTFSIGFREREYDESKRARLIAQKIKSNHHEYILDYNSVINDLDDIILYYDEPFGDPSAIPSFYVAKLAKEKVKVVLTGDCADELFGGYEKYLGRYYVDKYKKIPSVIRKIVSFLGGKIPTNGLTADLQRKIKKVQDNVSCNAFDLYYNLMSLGFNDLLRQRLLKPEIFRDIKPEIKHIYDSVPTSSILKHEQYTDIQIVLEGDMFVKVDRACMINSLENRAPFIDSRILEYALKLRNEFKIKGKNKKYILKKTFADLLPKKTITFSKRGFEVPVDHWFKTDLKDELNRVLAKDFIEQQAIFNYEEISQLKIAHLNGKENHKNKLWNLYVFQKWYLKNIK